MTLDSGLSWNDGQGIMLRPDMFEHTLLEQTRHHQSDIAASKSEQPRKSVDSFQSPGPRTVRESFPLQPLQAPHKIDVRSTPYSRYVPQFNRDNIRATLARNDTGYTHMGDALGGRPQDDRLYDRDGRANYELMAQEKTFQDRVRQVEQMAEDNHIVLMCTEADPLRCHRTLLVSQELASRGADIIHLMRDDQQESHEETMEKLLAVWKLLPDGDAGMTRRQLIEEAVRNQAAEVAYRRR